MGENPSVSENLETVYNLDDIGALSFDEAYQKLEQCAESLRQGGQGFAETTAMYHYSQALADHCTALLTRVSADETQG